VGLDEMSLDEVGGTLPYKMIYLCMHFAACTDDVLLILVPVPLFVIINFGK
jgi:hypothetical protein